MATTLARFEVSGFSELNVTIFRDGQGYRIASQEGTPDGLFRSTDEQLAWRAYAARVEFSLRILTR